MVTKEYVREFIEKQKTAMIASVDEEGFPNVKAMFTPRKIEGNSFYFTTNTSSMRTQQYMKNPKAGIYFYKRGRFSYEGIMLTGIMEVLQEKEIKEEIWSGRPGLLRIEIHCGKRPALLWRGQKRIDDGEFYMGESG